MKFVFPNGKDYNKDYEVILHGNERIVENW